MSDLEILSPQAKKAQARAMEAEERRQLRADLALAKKKDRMSTVEMLAYQREEANKRLGVTHRSNEVNMSEAIRRQIEEDQYN